MYYPKSQIISGLYTNGDKLVLAKNNTSYIGYYHELSNGELYSGKNPLDTPNYKLIPIPQNIDPTDPGLSTPNVPYIDINYSNVEDNIPENYTQNNTIHQRIVPPFSPNIPLPIQSDTHTRYFCKKNNELKYIEISKETYDLLSSKSNNIAWDLYTPIKLNWKIKGIEKEVYLENKKTISIIEKTNKWYGFSKYLKEDYLKYYIK